MENFSNICNNQWCKALFFYTEKDMTIVKNENIRDKKIEILLDENKKEAPRYCKKCQSFDKEISGGVEWKEKTYEGSRFDTTPHEIKYKVTNYR